METGVPRWQSLEPGSPQRKLLCDTCTMVGLFALNDIVVPCLAHKLGRVFDGNPVRDRDVNSHGRVPRQVHPAPRKRPRPRHGFRMSLPRNRWDG